MNLQETLKKMIEAAAGAAKVHWPGLRSFAETELRKLAEAAAWLEADLIADLAAARLESDPGKSDEQVRLARLRAELGFDCLRLAAEGVITMAKADAKIAAQDAINAAVGVLRGAINESIGLVVL